jgi:hypothetical protein
MINDFEHFERFLDANSMTTLRASEFLRLITAQVNLSTILTGSGSPEGAIEAEITQLYMDTAGSAGSILYVKKTGAGNTGWILV